MSEGVPEQHSERAHNEQALRRRHGATTARTTAVIEGVPELYSERAHNERPTVRTLIRLKEHDDRFELQCTELPSAALNVGCPSLAAHYRRVNCVTYLQLVQRMASDEQPA